MKGRIQTLTKQSQTNKNESLYRYLKPGALAKLRDSKIISRSHRYKTLETQMSLYLLNLSPTATSSSSPIVASPAQNIPTLNQIGEGFPCFALRINRPRCLQRNKIAAVTPEYEL